jgi:hypothetical protein
MRAYSPRWLVLTVLSLAAVVVGFTNLSLVASQPPDQDRILGTWVLNVAKSKYTPGPTPKSQRRTYDMHPEGIKTTIVTVFPDGKSTTVEFVAGYDSMEHPVTGSAGSDMIRMKKISDETAEAILSHAGTVIGVARRVISRDGKTMTISYQGKDSRDNLVKSESLYEKQ